MKVIVRTFIEYLPVALPSILDTLTAIGRANSTALFPGLLTDSVTFPVPSLTEYTSESNPMSTTAL